MCALAHGKHLLHMSVRTHSNNRCYFHGLPWRWVVKNCIGSEERYRTVGCETARAKAFMSIKMRKATFECVFFHKWWQNESAEMRFLRLSWHVEMRVCALTCKHVTQFRLSASMTRTKAREAIFRPSHRDSTKGMLPTCQSQLKQSSNIPSNAAITVCLCWCYLPASRSKALWEPVRARNWRQADNSM